MGSRWRHWYGATEEMQKMQKMQEMQEMQRRYHLTCVYVLWMMMGDDYGWH